MPCQKPRPGQAWSTAAGRRDWSGGLPAGASRGVAHVQPGRGQCLPDRVGGGEVALLAQGRPQLQERLDGRPQSVPGVGEPVLGGPPEPPDQAAQQRARLLGALVLVGVGVPLADRGLELQDHPGHRGRVAGGRRRLEPPLGRRHDLGQRHGRQLLAVGSAGSPRVSASPRVRPGRRAARPPGRGPADPLDQLAQLRQGQGSSRGQDQAVAGPPDGQAAPAADLDVARAQVDQRCGVLVHAQHGGVLAELALHPGQPAFAEVAVPGVVAAALGVVVVGDDRDGEAERAEQVEPGRPVGRAACLIYLVDRQREPARGGGGRRGQHGQPVAGQDPVPQPGRDRPGLPVRQRVGGAARPGEHPVRRPDGRGLLRLVLLVPFDQRRRHRGVRARAGARRDPHRQADAVREVPLGARRDVGGVFLEGVGGGQHHRLRAGHAEPRHQVPVHRDHRRAGLAGPDDGQDAAARVRSHPSYRNQPPQIPPRLVPRRSSRRVR